MVTEELVFRYRTCCSENTNKLVASRPCIEIIMNIVRQRIDTVIVKQREIPVLTSKWKLPYPLFEENAVQDYLESLVTRSNSYSIEVVNNHRSLTCHVTYHPRMVVLRVVCKYVPFQASTFQRQIVAMKSNR